MRLVRILYYALRRFYTRAARRKMRNAWLISPTPPHGAWATMRAGTVLVSMVQTSIGPVVSSVSGE